MTVHSPGPIIWTFNDLTIYLRASLFFVTFGVRQNRSKTRSTNWKLEVRMPRRMRARRRPDRVLEYRSEKNLHQKRYKKVFGKKASERERLLNGNYALCILFALIMHQCIIAVENQKLKPTKLTSDIISPFKWHVMARRTRTQQTQPLWVVPDVASRHYYD